MSCDWLSGSRRGSCSTLSSSRFCAHMSRAPQLARAPQLQLCRAPAARCGASAAASWTAGGRCWARCWPPTPAPAGTPPWPAASTPSHTRSKHCVLEMATNLRKVSQCLEKAHTRLGIWLAQLPSSIPTLPLVGPFSGHCQTSRVFVYSSIVHFTVLIQGVVINIA